MDILERHQNGLSRRQSLHLRDQSAKRLLLALPRGEAEFRIAVPIRDRQQVCQQRSGLARAIRSLRHHRLKLVQPSLGTILPPKPGRPFELCDDWMESAILMVGRAIIAHPRVWLGAQLLKNGLGNTRLADTRLARDENHRALPGFCCCQRRSSNSISASRPTSGVMLARNASNRLSAALAPSTCQAGTVSAKRLSAAVPRS